MSDRRNFRLRRIAAAQEGATILEFAIVAPMLLLIMMAIIEYGLIQFNRAALESVVAQAGRQASLGVTSDDRTGCSKSNQVDYVKCYIQVKTEDLIGNQGEGGNIIITATPLVVGTSTGAKQPDICLSDPPSVTSCPNNIPYIDRNGNGLFDGLAETNSYGANGQLMHVRVYYPWRTILPYLDRFFAQSDNEGNRAGVIMLTAATIVKNEPSGTP